MSKGMNILSELLTTVPSREFASQEEVDLYERAKTALNEEAAENWDNAAWHAEQAALITEQLDYGFKNENVFSSYFPTQNVGKHEKVVIRETRGMKVFWTARNGQIDESQLRTDEWELPRETLGWHVSEFEDNIEANYAETIERLVGYAKQREEAEVNRRIFTLMQEAIPSSSEYYEDASAGLDEGVLNPLISEVADTAPPSSGRLLMPLSIVGRASAIDQISDFNGFSNEAKEEIRLRGRLGVYRGANVVRLTNWQDEEGIPYIAEDELFILGGGVGRLVNYGGAKIRRWIENGTDYVHYRSRRDLGAAVWHPENARRIKIG